MTGEFYSNSVEETEKIALNFAKELKAGDFIALYGDLGAGKTAFIRAFTLSFIPDAPVQSPTYTIINEYKNDHCTICHCDMYRIESEDDLESIGFYDYDHCIMAVEWCEKIPFAIPKSHYAVRIFKIDHTKRKIVITKEGE